MPSEAPVTPAADGTPGPPTAPLVEYARWQTRMGATLPKPQHSGRSTALGERDGRPRRPAPGSRRVRRPDPLCAAAATPVATTATPTPAPSAPSPPEPVTSAPADAAPTASPATCTPVDATPTVVIAPEETAATAAPVTPAPSTATRSTLTPPPSSTSGPGSPAVSPPALTRPGSSTQVPTPAVDSSTSLTVRETVTNPRAAPPADLTQQVTGGEPPTTVVELPRTGTPLAALAGSAALLLMLGLLCLALARLPGTAQTASNPRTTSPRSAA